MELRDGGGGGSAPVNTAESAVSAGRFSRAGGRKRDVLMGEPVKTSGSNTQEGTQTHRLAIAIVTPRSPRG